MRMPNSICTICQNSFYARPSAIKNGYGKYCSNACYSIAKTGVKKVVDNCKCKQCGNSFYRSLSQIKRGSGKYCSRKCRDSAKIGMTGDKSIAWKGGTITLICPICKNQFSVYRCLADRKICCSRKCEGINRRTYTDKELMTEIMIRNSEEMRNWRTQVFERDNYTCQKCGQIGVKLNAHHIIPFSKDKSLRFDISNGITLCVQCHKKDHKRLRKMLRKSQIDLFTT